MLCSHSEVSLCSEEAAAEDDDEAMADAGEVNRRSTGGQREVNARSHWVRTFDRWK